MPRISDDYKSDRLARVISLLRHNPDGLMESEIADELGFDRRVVNNYLRELQDRGEVDKDQSLWLINPDHQAARLSPLALLPEQAVTLYLATRLLVKQTDKRNEAAESALYKLADVLTGDMNVGEEIRQAARELAERAGDQTYSRVFQTVVRGYLYRRTVHMSYAPRGKRPFEAMLQPYLLEPSAVGFSTYVIGYCEPPGAVHEYKIERIVEAELTSQSYVVPPEFPGLEILRNAWSVIFGDNVVEVILRFHPSVVDRVKETRWHLSEQTMPDPEKPGWLRWSAQVADTTDMLPWIRGWGADVEVLAPQELRDSMMGEAREMAQLYGWHLGDPDDTSGSPDHKRFNQIFGRGQ